VIRSLCRRGTHPDRRWRWRLGAREIARGSGRDSVAIQLRGGSCQFGIADYQAIISKGLNSEVIEWRGIEATEKLAEPPNAKMIIIGSGKDGLPVILDAAGSQMRQVANK
jgi:hypothetical protein